ncbi:anthranilate phosphoribosyltransferase [mine drainage metagenome]|uniref:Anthranilate phosphoribosyltransferase n=1 Tax=mine drainage metagenome TaxID=410659 RepID=A0A1J5PGF4_9ZZZZ
MKNVGPTSVELATRTIFNLLGPLSNPAGVKRQMVGVFSKHWVQPLAQVLVVAVVLAVAAPVPVAPVVPIAPAAVVAQVAPAVPAESSADRSETGTNFCCFMPVSLL